MDHTLIEWLHTIDPWSAAGAGVVALSTIASSAHAIISRRSAQSAIAWVGMIVLVPVGGALLYLLLGINRIRTRARSLRYATPEVRRRLRQDSVPSQPPEHMVGLARLGQQVTGLGLLGGNRVQMLRNGDDAYRAMLDAIDQAEDSIALCSYIFDRDETGMRFVEAIARATSRGVSAHVLIDAVGVRYHFPSVLGALKAAGSQAAVFMPILRPGKFAFINLRNHRKLLVVDGRVGFTGGMNIRHAFTSAAPQRKRAHDTHFQLDGPVVAHLHHQFIEDWAFATGEVLRDELAPSTIASAGEVLARGVPSGPDADFANIQWVLFGLLQAARERVVIVTPYFLPEESMLDALQVAAMRGVQVDVVMPQRSNLPFVDWASRSSWGPLLKRGVQLWLCPPPFDHSKLVAVDSMYSLIGSANWDPRSLKLNFEFNVEAYDDDLAGDIEALAEAKIEAATLVTLEDWAGRGWPRRMWDGLFRLGTPYF